MLSRARLPALRCPGPSYATRNASAHSRRSSPLNLVADELANIGVSISALLGSSHPSLDRAAKYYASSPGKRMRPAVVLLLARATNGMSPRFCANQAAASAGSSIDDSLEPPSVLLDSNPDVPSSSFPSARLSSLEHPSLSHLSSLSRDLSDKSSSPSSHRLHEISSSQEHDDDASGVLPSQRRLAEITEMIHVASLMHDDVVDSAAQRRSQPSAPTQFGNKISILAGDFLLGRASAALSRLGSLEVVELVASVLSNLVEGEIRQMRGHQPHQQPSPSSSSTTTSSSSSPSSSFPSSFSSSSSSSASSRPSSSSPFSSSSSSSSSPSSSTPSLSRDSIWSDYLLKTYLKTASLIAKSARASVVLGGCGSRQGWVDGESIKNNAYDYGRHLGLAFQLVDDTLDITADARTLGKPSEGADLKLGLATGPTLFAWEQFPQLGALIARDFSGPGDAEEARELVVKSEGVNRTLELANRHAQEARKALEELPQNEATESLRQLTYTVLDRDR